MKIGWRADVTIRVVNTGRVIRARGSGIMIGENVVSAKIVVADKVRRIGRADVMGAVRKRGRVTVRRVYGVNGENVVRRRVAVQEIANGYADVKIKERKRARVMKCVESGMIGERVVFRKNVRVTMKGKEV